MADQSLQVGDLVEILPPVDPPVGQPMNPRRYGRVLATADENDRAAIQVKGRQHPLHLPMHQLRRVDPSVRWAD